MAKCVRGKLLCRLGDQSRDRGAFALLGLTLVLYHVLTGVIFSLVTPWCAVMATI